MNADSLTDLWCYSFSFNFQFLREKIHYSDGGFTGTSKSSIGHQASGCIKRLIRNID